MTRSEKARAKTLVAHAAIHAQWEADRRRREWRNWTELQQEIRAAWDKRTRPMAVFPDRDSKLRWLAEGARTGCTPPLPEGAYWE